MFDRFTDKAKMTLNFARMAAQEFGCEYIAPEHVLHGLLRAGECGASRILVKLKVDSGALLEQLRKRMRRAEFQGSAQLPFTPGTKQALVKTMEAAQAAGHNYIGTEHLLLGLGEADPDVVGALFREQGLSQELLVQAFFNAEHGYEAGAEAHTARRHVLRSAAHIARELGDDETARKLEALIQRLSR